MKRTIKITVCAAMLLCSVAAFGQTYLRLANDCYQKGDYECAFKNYIKSMNDNEGQNVDVQIDRARYCVDLLKEGNNAFFADDFVKAKYCYSLILRTNPNDQNVMQRIAKCEQYLSSASVKTGNDALYANGWTVMRNGQYLRDDEIRTLFANSKAYKLYNSGMKKYDSSNLLWYGCGGALIFAGGCCQASWLNYGTHYAKSDGIPKGAIVGWYLAGGGIALFIVGGTRTITGKHKISKAVNLYNNGKMYSSTPIKLKYGITPNGAGLALNF